MSLAKHMNIPVHIEKFLIRGLFSVIVLAAGIMSILGSGGGDSGVEGDSSTGSYVWISIRNPDDGRK